ncbi:MAG: nucleotidyltransferase domain-containing protein, partial [candidate division NC10 bacterium]|nr:nucleotidyltransferase domain-containing protein [candidate division NC10 bacterium]
MKDLRKIKRKLKEVLEKEEDILFAYLYGSVALGMGHQWSDLDIA